MREHGTYAAYTWGIEPGPGKGCRCFECSDAAYRYEKARQRDREAGIEPYVDNTEAREHLAWLSKNQVGRVAISAKTGLSKTTLWKIATGKVTESREDTIDKIMAVGLHNGAASSLVDAAETWRRIDALMAKGWTKSDIGHAIGQNRTKPRGHGALQLGRDQISRRHERLIEQLWRTHVYNDPKAQDRRRRKRASRNQPLSDSDFALKDLLTDDAQHGRFDTQGVS